MPESKYYLSDFINPSIHPATTPHTYMAANHHIVAGSVQSVSFVIVSLQLGSVW